MGNSAWGVSESPKGRCLESWSPGERSALETELERKASGQQEGARFTDECTLTPQTPGQVHTQIRAEPQRHTCGESEAHGKTFMKQLLVVFLGVEEKYF